MIDEIISPLRQNFPEITSHISKLSEDPEFQNTLGKAGSIGGLVNIGFYIFNTIRKNLKSRDEILFASFVKIIFESAT